VRCAIAVLVATIGSLWTIESQAAPPWVDRRITPLSGQWNFDFGLGIGHAPNDSAAGINMELGVGLTDRVELGVRTGLRFGDDFERGIHADQYGRLFDRQYFDGGDQVLANPEVRVRWAFLEGSVGEMGLEGRFIVPLENNTYAGFEPGLPVALHLGDRVRLDTGVWMPMVFTNPAVLGLSVPVDIWIQATPRLWLGPMTGLYFNDINGAYRNDQSTSVSMGFGLGYQITRYLDFKTQFLFPELNQDSRVFGLGAGVQIRIE
jgi:hypothetical protein